MSTAAEFAKAKTVRTTVRRNVTTAITTLQALIKSAAPDSEDIEDQLAILAKLEPNLNQLDETVMEYLTIDTEVEAEANKAQEYEKNITLTRTQAERKLRALAGNTVASSGTSSASGNVVHFSREERLPTLILPKFSGEITEWTGFWSQFETTVANRIESKVTRFNYLCSYLEGEAKRTISGMKASEANYDEAVKLLTARFGRTDLVIHSHSKKLMTAKAVHDSNNVVALRNLYDTIQVNVRCLRALNVKPEDSGVFICPVLIECLPSDIRLEYSKQKDAEWDLNVFIDFLEKEVVSRETCSVLNNNRPVSTHSNQDRNQGHAKFSKQDKKPSGNLNASATMLSTTVNQEPRTPYCIFCDSSTSHSSSNCTQRSLEEKRRVVYESGRCYICLRKNHEASECRTRNKNCRLCRKKHNSAVCEQNPAHQKSQQSSTSKKSEATSDAINVTATPVTNYKTVRLQTAKIVARNPNKPELAEPIKCLLDHAAQASFVKTEVARKLKLPVIGEIMIEVAEFGNDKPREERRKLVKIVLESRWDNQQRREITAIEAPYLCNVSTTVCSEKIEIYAKENRLELADQPDENSAGSGDVGVIIGGDVYYDFIKEDSGMKRLNKTLVFTNTIFGWTLQGPAGQQSNGISTNMIKVKVMKIGVREIATDKIVQSFWDLEAIGITPELEPNPMDEKIIENFKANVKFTDGRYVVTFPWKAEKQTLPDNLHLAVKRAKAQNRKFKLDPILYQECKRIIEEQLDNGIVEKVPEQTVVPLGTCYLPAQAVRRDESTTTKVRVVLDGSAHARGGPSLNDCLESGPNLNPDLLLLLLEFRKHKIAVTADIEKAFLQVSLSPEDRDSVRFLLPCETNGKIDENKFTTLRMARVPFGITCSPYLLGITIKNHVEKYVNEEPEAVKALKESLYVDDFLSGARTVKEAFQLSRKSSEILREASMPLRKWQTNSKELRTLWGNENKDDRAPVKFHGEAEAKVQNILGIRWNPESDDFSFDLRKLQDILRDIKHTKRHVLSAVAQIFDPIGILGPFVVRAKFIFQSLWKLKKNWDEPLPEDLRNEFQQWCNEMLKIRHVKLARCYFGEPGETITKLDLHSFCDASSKAYATAIYVRYETDQGNIGVTLVTSKARVAPLKSELTIPKLELMGCILGARLTNKVQKIFQDQAEEIGKYYWTDSTVALYWIRGQEKQWKPFVQNRTTEIHKLSEVKKWFHCPGEGNPADIPTRGASVNELAKGKLWWEGPPWLKLDEAEWPADQFLPSKIPDEVEEEKRKTVLAITIPKTRGISKIIELENYRSINKAFRITAYVQRFIKLRVKKEKTEENYSNAITAEELANAERTWIRCVQGQDYPEEIAALSQGKLIARNSKLASFQPILNEDGLLCIGGRLGESKLSFGSKHPIIINKDQPLAHGILLRSHEQMLHCGIQNTVTQLREKYWIPSVRQLARKIIHNCIICKFSKTKPAEMDTAPLPKERITQAPAFEILGIDFAGPLLVKNDNHIEKNYICLFTCAVTRAIHLELVESLTTYDFMLALRSLIGRRGIPHVIYTDNAKTFQRANKDLQNIWKTINDIEVKQFYGTQGITWRFIVERAAWYGGWWERLVRSTKTTLKKVLGHATLNSQEMRTTLVEIEAVINSRPLTYLYSDSTEPIPLTPADFLIGKRITTLPPSVFKGQTVPKTNKEMTKGLKQRNLMMERLWKRWKHEYLMELRSAHNIELAKNSTEIRVGDVMQIHEDKIPKQAWKLGVVTETIKGRDGKIRACFLRTPNGNILRRPIQLLYPLEIN